MYINIKVLQANVPKLSSIFLLVRERETGRGREGKRRERMKRKYSLFSFLLFLHLFPFHFIVNLLTDKCNKL